MPIPVAAFAAVAQIAELLWEKWQQSQDNTTSKEIDNARREHDATRFRLFLARNDHAVIREAAEEAAAKSGVTLDAVFVPAPDGGVQPHGNTG